MAYGAVTKGRSYLLSEFPTKIAYLNSCVSHCLPHSHVAMCHAAGGLIWCLLFTSKPPLPPDYGSGSLLLALTR